MLRLIFFNFKTIIKNKLIIIYLIFLAGCEGILIKFSLIDVTPSRSIGYATASNNLSIIFFVFFLIFSYESFRNIKEVDLFGTFSTKQRGLRKVWFSRLIILMVLVCIAILPFFVHYTLIYQKFNLSHFYYLNTLNSVILNFVFVSIIGCLVGSLLSIRNNRIKGYIKAAIVVFFISPLFARLVSNIYMQYGDFNSFNFFPLINRLQILPPNLNMGDHSIYGMPTEIIRWESAIMLVIILSIALLKKVSENKKVLYTCTMSAIIVLWVCFALIVTPSDSLVRKNPIYFQGRESDWIYDSQSPQQLKAPDFSITEYNMDFKIRRQLYGDVEIVIGDKSSDNNYNFTLYRGYNIMSVIDNNANELEFDRDGHYITIFAYDDTDKISIEYKGNGNIFYSNNQGIALTGNFPYYPVAGYTTIPIQTTNSKIKFNIVVDTNQVVFSNIDGEDNHFIGVSDTLTLVSGFLTEYEIGNFTFIGCSIYDDNLDIEDLANEVVNLNDKVGTNFSISSNMKIFYPPDQLFQNVGYVEDTMVYDNHIITEWPSTKWICRGMVDGSLPDDQDTFILRLAFLDTLFYLDSVRERVSPKFPSEKEIELYKNLSNENYMQKERVITKLLLYQIDTLGEDIVCTKVYKYLKNNDNTIDQLDFLMEIK